MTKVYFFCSGCKLGACIDDIQIYILVDDENILHIDGALVQISIDHARTRGYLEAPELFLQLKYHEDSAQKTMPEQLKTALLVHPEFEHDLRQYLVQSVLPVEIHGYLEGDWQQADDPLLDRRFGMRAQGDDVRSIVHIHNFSTAAHNCNKIGHHSGS
jgi:hypothetical protein